MLLDDTEIITALIRLLIGSYFKDWAVLLSTTAGLCFPLTIQISSLTTNTANHFLKVLEYFTHF